MYEKAQKIIYDKAKRTQLPEDWSAYQLTRNTVNVLLDTAHKNYCANLFTESFQNNKKQFWSYIKRIQKDHSGVSSLIVNGETNSCAKDKARILNNQFELVFTNEGLSNISTMTSDATPQMPSISFSAHACNCNAINITPACTVYPSFIVAYQIMELLIHHSATE